MGYAPGEAVFSGGFPSVAFNPVSEEFLVVWHGDDFVDGKFEIYGQNESTGLPEVKWGWMIFRSVRQAPTS